MIVRNPTNTEISVTYKGITYSAPANGEVKGVPESAAQYWKESTHNFIDIAEEVSKTPAKVEPVVDADPIDPVVPVVPETVLTDSVTPVAPLATVTTPKVVDKKN